MAGVQTIEEEFLTCSICMEIYTDPCTLTCGHSLCRKCVTQFIKTRPDAVQSRTIPCAICRQVTPVPRPVMPVEEWAGQIRPSLILQGLMDRHHSGHNHHEEKDVCILCKEVGETIQASAWCSDCEITLCSRCAKMHPKTPYSKNHEIVNLSQGTNVKQRRKIKCKEHDGELIKFICKDCNKAVCPICCLMKHAKHNFVIMSAFVPKMKSALTEKRHVIHKKMKQNLTHVKSEESSIEQLKNKKTRSQDEIQSETRSAIALLRTKEANLLKELGDAYDKQIGEHQANVKTGQITNQMYQQHCKFIDQALQSESEVDTFDMYQVCMSGAVESMEDTESDARTTLVVREVTFAPNMEPLKKAITEMGEVSWRGNKQRDTESEARTSSHEGEVKLTPNIEPLENVVAEMGKVKLRGNSHDPNVLSTPVLHDTIDIKHSEDTTNTYPNVLSTPVLHDTIDIKHSEDTTNTYPNDVTVLTVDGLHILVVADYVNKSLKSVDLMSKTKSVLKLSASPIKITKMERNRVVSNIRGGQIIIAEVRPELVLITTLKTRKQYRGLTSLPDSTLAGGSGSPPAVDIFDLSGKVLRSFSPHNDHLNLILQPIDHCTTYEGNILVSDDGSKSVYCLSPEGNVVFTYKPSGERALREPRGIAVASTGDILLADRNLQKIIHLTSDGTFVRDILPSVWHGADTPWGLCFDDTNKLYICLTENNQNFIKVVSFKQG